MNDCVVRDVEDLTLPQPSFDKVWGHRILTSKGICTIEMRVDHNGYYSGWLNVFYLSQKITSRKTNHYFTEYSFGPINDF